MSLLKKIFETEENKLERKLERKTKELYLDKCRKSCNYKDIFESGSSIYFIESYRCIPEQNEKLMEKTFYEACSLLRFDKNKCKTIYEQKKQDYDKYTDSLINKAEIEFKNSKFKPID